MKDLKTEEEIEKFERMRHRDKRKPFMFYPEDQSKANWDLFITLVLIFTCLSTPYRIAFIDKDNLRWIILNYCIDFLFLVDIIFIFNTAYNDDDFTIVDDRKLIAKGYCYSWFSIDFLAIVPFDQLIQGVSAAGMNDVVRIARIGRMYKLIKLTRLLRILKIMKERNKLLKYVQDFMKIGIGFERLFFFIFIFLVLCHIVSCLWVFVAKFQEDDEAETYEEKFASTWLSDFIN